MYDQSVKMNGQEIGEVEGAGFGFMQMPEFFLAGKHFIAMSAGQSLDIFLSEPLYPAILRSHSPNRPTNIFS